MVRVAVTKEELTKELKHLRKRVAELETRVTGYQNAYKKSLSIENEEKYKAVFESASEIIVVMDKKGRIIDINNKCKEIIGIEKEEILGKNIRSLVIESPNDSLNGKSRNILLNNLQKRTDGIYVTPYQIEIAKKNGELITLEIEACALTKNGRVVGDLAIMRDITERKRMEEALREGEERLHVMMDASTEGFVMRDSEKIIDVNKTGAQMLGYRRDEMLGRSGIDFIPSESFDLVMEKVAASHDEPFKALLKRKDGTVFPAEIRGREVTYKNNTVRLSSFRDLTEQEQYNNLLETIVLHAPSSMSIMEGQHFKFVNKQFCQDLGYTEEEMLSMDVMHTVHPEDRALVRSCAVQMLKGERTEPFEFRAFHKNGKMLWVLQSVAPITYDGRRASIGTYLNITEQKQAEIEYKTVIQMTIDGFCLLDTNGRFLDVNDAYCELIGYRRDELLKMNIADVEILQKPEEVAERIANIKKDGRDRFETHHKCKDGRIINVEISVNYIEAGGGRLFVFLRDITEQRQAEQALRESEQNLKEAQSLGRIGNWEFDLITGQIKWSDETYRIYERDKALGPPTVEDEARYYSPEQARKLREYVQLSIDTDREYNYDLTANLPGGKTLLLNTSVRPVKNENKQVVKVFGIVQDITERKKAEQELKESHERFKELADLLPLSIYEINNEGKFIYYNEEAMRCWNMTSETTPKDNMLEAFVPEDRNRIVENTARVLMGENVGAVEYTALRQDGTTLPVLVYASPIIHENDVVGIRGVSVDITERKRAEEALRASEAKYRFLSENMADIAFTIDMNMMTTYISPSIERILGFTPEERLRQLPQEQLTPKSFKLAVETLSRELQKEEKTGIQNNNLFVLELEYYHKDGSVRIMETTLRAVRDDQGKPVAIYGLCHDITERKNTENELRIREQKLRSIFGTAPIGIGMITNRFLVEFNDYLCEISGYTREELFEKSVRILYPSDNEYEAARKQIYEEIIQKGSSSIETRWRHKSGELIDVTVNTVPLNLPALQEAITFTVMNVTERKKAEVALKESEERYRLIVNNSRDIIYTMNIDGEITYVSPSIQEVLGYSQQEFTGYFMAPLIHPDDMNRVTESLRRSIVEGYQSSGIEYRIRDASGEWRWNSSKGTIVRDKNGNFLHFLGVATDITERKKAEEALKISEERFRRLAENARDIIFRFHPPPSIGFDYISPAVQRILGYTPEEFYTDSLLIFKVIHPDSRAFLEEITSRPQDYLDKPAVIQWIRKDGEIIWTEQRSVPVYDGDKLIAIEGIVRDITERRKSEEALRVSEEKYRNSLDSSPLGIRIVAEDGNTVYANQAMLAIYGYESIDELNAIKTNDRYTPESYAEHVLRMEKRRHGEPVTPKYEISIVRKDSSIRHLQVFRKEVFWEGKTQYQALYNDITEQKRAEVALKNSEERFRRLAENARDIIFRYRVGENPGFEYVSRSSTQISGYSPEEFYNDPDLLSRIIYHEDQHLMQSFWNNVQEQDKAFISRWRHKNGRINWIEQRGTYIFDESGQVVAIQGIARDVTEREKAAHALRESEANYRNSIANSPMGIMVFKREGEIIYANQALLDIYGFGSLEELQNIPVKERYTPESYAEYMVRHEEFINGETGPMDYEISVVRKDKTIRHLQAYRREVVWGGENQYQLLYFDITERKNAEDEMRESRARFRQLARLLPQSIWETDEKGMITYINEKTMEVYGYSRQDAVPMSYLQNLIPQDRERAAQNTQRILEGEVLGGIPYTALRKDGSVFPAMIYASAIVKNGKGAGLRGITIDITEQKTAEKRMEQAAQEWRTTFDSLTDMVCIVGNDFRISRVNRAYADMLKKEPQELLGKICYELIHNTDCPHTDCPHRKTMRTGKPATTEFYEPSLKTYVEASTSPIFDENGNIKGSVHVMRDISERKHMEQQLMLTDRLASVGELASGVAHELNNPLTSVIGFSQLLMEGEIPENIKEDLNLINGEAQRAASIVKNLLTFARKHAAVKQATRINSLIEDVLKLRAYEHKVNNIEVIRSFSTNIPEIMVDYFQIQQVFLNLIINAEFFMSETHHGGVLKISTERVRDVVKVSFADDGPGIPSENLTRIFDPFFTTKEVGKGTGLGLSICHGIVTEHGGRIYAESELGKGTTFIIELPVPGEIDKAGE